MGPKEQRVVIEMMADRISATFMGGIPANPTIEAIEAFLREEGIVLVNEWEMPVPARAVSTTEETGR